MIDCTLCWVQHKYIFSLGVYFIPKIYLILRMWIFVILNLTILIVIFILDALLSLIDNLVIILTIKVYLTFMTLIYKKMKKIKQRVV